MAFWFILCAILIIGLIFLDQWRTDKKRFVFLQAVAKRLGIDELERSCWTENGQCAIFRCNGSTSEAIEVKPTNQPL